MKKWRLIILLGFFLAAIWILPTPARESNQALAKLIPDDGLVVKVYFNDIDTARKIAISYEPLESNYENGYLLLAVSPEEHSELINAGLTVIVDENLTNAYASQPETTNLVELAAIPGFECYRTVEETFDTAISLVNLYPNLATWTDVGDSWEKTQGLGGYDLQVLKLTNSAIPGPKPKIFITSAIHAREYTTAELTTRLAENLVTSYGSDADSTWILDHHEIHFMLQANPDGRKQAETGILWRKNTNQNYCSPTSNNRGADLNRNFPFNWGCCGGSSSNQCSTTYRGASAASEPETQTVVNYIEANFVDARGPNENDPAPLDTEGIYLDIHSSGRLLLWPWGNTSDPAPNGTQLQTLGRKLAYFNGHTPQQSIGLYPTDGTTTSYAYGEMGLAAFTYELGTEFFESCSYFENTLVPDNIPSLMYALKVGRTPYLTPSGPDALNLSLDPGTSSPVPSGTTVNLTATINDTRYNNSNGSEPTQIIAAAEYYVDIPPWDGGTAVAMNAADGSFSSSVEAVVASVDTTGWSEGQHLIFVRGQDAAGNWGAFSAEFLTIDDNATLPVTLFFDDFESSQGWVTNPNGTDTATTGQWERANPEPTNSNGPKQLGDTVSGSFDLVTAGAAGSSVGANDVDGGETSVRSPDIILPNSGDVTLSFSYYLAHTNNSSAADYLRVNVVGSSSTMVFEELGAANNDNGVWESFSVNLNSFAGQTVHLLVEAADASGGSIVEAALDDVRVEVINGGPTPTPTNTPLPTDTPTPTHTPTATPTTDPGQLPIFFDDFESDLGWISNPNSTDTATTGQWERANPEGTNSSGAMQLGDTVSGNFDLVTEGSAGSSVGANDIDGGITSIRSPNINLPGSGDITLSFSYYLAHLSNATTEDFLRVSVVGSSTAVVFEELGSGDVDNGAWATASVNLNSFAGQSVYLLIEAADAGSGSLIEAAIDDVRIDGMSGGPSPTPTNPPPPTLTPSPTPNPGSCITTSSTNVPVALPNGASTINSTLTVSAASVIADINVSLDMSHAWVGDVSMVLTHNDTGTAVTILDRPGVPGSTYGCSSDDILATLDDESGTAVEGVCAGAAPAINGTFSPNNPLAAFDGENGNGTWTLSVTDHYTSADAGSLDGWSVEICNP